MKRVASTFLALLITAALLMGTVILARAQVAKHDLVILHGRVMDPETGFDGIRNVGIKNGKIITITKDGIGGKESINAEGLVVAPGFIDTHFHGLSPHGVKLALRNGVTTGMDLELGALEIDKWYAEKEKTGWQMNYGTTISHEFVRRLLLDGVDGTDIRDLSQKRIEAGADGESSWASHICTSDEINAILKAMDEGLRQGAIGVGSTLGYMSAGVSSTEMFLVQQIAARYGRLTSVHNRFLSSKPPADNALGVQEVLANALVIDAPLLICHFNNDNWRLIHNLILLSRKRGLNVWGEIFPYLAGSIKISSLVLLPENWVDNLGLKYEETVFDPIENKYLNRDEYEKLAKDDPDKIVVAVMRKKEWLNEWLDLPGETVVSDGMLPIDENGKLLTWDDDYDKGVFHPRTSGAQGKALRLSRAFGIPLMQTLSMLSYNSAKYLGDTGLESMKIRGRIQEGMVADITVFDPEAVTENSTYATGKNGLPTTGIYYVIVNGSLVVKGSRVLKGVEPGKAIRFPIEDKGRYEPVIVETWSSNYTEDISGLSEIH